MRSRHATASRNPLNRLAAADRFASTVVTALLGLAAATLLACAVATVALGLTVHTVLTGSMTGTYDAGSVVIARTIPTADVRPGQVLVFTPPGTRTPYTHRVMTVTTGPGGPVITTKGDANPAPDPWKARLAGAHAYEVVFGIPLVGRLLQPLHRWQPLLFGALGALIAISGTRSILGRPRPKRSPRPRPA